MSHRLSGFGRAWGWAALGHSNAADCQAGMVRDGLAGLFYPAMLPLMRLALGVYFRRVHRIHVERFPRNGAVLLVANHPSTWTDVLVLDVVLGRRLHFLASEDQFRPWPRRMLVELYGTLPLFRREERPDHLERNAVTFGRCERLFDRNEAVAVFPEGISLSDRGLLPFKQGAARLTLSYAGRGRPLRLVPVGLHYSDRTSLRSEVTVQVGHAIPMRELCAWKGGAREEAARGLTQRIADAIHELVLETPTRQARLASVLEPMAAGPDRALGLAAAVALTRSLAALELQVPARYAELERRARAFDRRRRALGVSERALAGSSSGEVLRDLGAVLAGALPALVGALAHIVPATLTDRATRRYLSQPSRISFARIASGFLFFSLAYAIEGIVLFRSGGGRVWLLAALPAAAILGVFTLDYARRIRLFSDRLRVAWLARRHKQAVGRARRDRELLRAQVEALLR